MTQETNELVVIQMDRESAAALYTALTCMGNQCMTQQLWSEMDDILTDEEKEAFAISINPIDGNSPEVIYAEG